MPDLDHAALEAAARAATNPFGKLLEHVAAAQAEREAFRAKRDAAEARATAAEAELAALKAERDEALCIAEGPSTLIDLARGSVERGFALHAAEAERDRMKAALERADAWLTRADPDPVDMAAGDAACMWLNDDGWDEAITLAAEIRAALAGEKEPTNEA